MPGSRKEGAGDDIPRFVLIQIFSLMEITIKTTEGKTLVFSNYVESVGATEVFVRVDDERNGMLCKFIEALGGEYMNETSVEAEEGVLFDYYAL